jgi:hypothetical protein
MTTPDEIARQIIRAAQSGDGDTNVMAYAEVLLRRWREEIRQDEITTCARVWKSKTLIDPRFWPKT